VGKWRPPVAGGHRRPLEYTVCGYPVHNRIIWMNEQAQQKARITA